MRKRNGFEKWLLAMLLTVSLVSAAVRPVFAEEVIEDGKETEVKEDTGEVEVDEVEAGEVEASEVEAGEEMEEAAEIQDDESQKDVEIQKTGEISKYTSVEQRSASPAVTASSVTWNGGFLKIPVNLGGYSAEDIDVNISVRNGSGKPSMFTASTITNNEITASVLSSFDSCEQKQICTDAGTYSMTVNFYNKSSHAQLGTSTLSLVVSQNSTVWNTPEKMVNFDGNQNVAFTFTNGTNYYAL